jgi:ATP-dependent Clp protease ATP-binding subunit ClpA/plasmid stability protein
VATLHVRNVPDALYEALRARAQTRGRSIGNEAIAILAENVARGVVQRQPLGLRRAPTRAPRERFSDRAGRALAAASYEAHALGHDSVESEHILLGLLGEGSVAVALDTVGVSAEQIRDAVETHVERGPSVGPGLRPFGPGAKRVLELALRESLGTGEGVIEPDHILVAIAADEEGTAGHILRELGITVDSARGASIVSGQRMGPAFAEEYCAVTLTGSAEDWTEQLNAQAREGWKLVETISDGAERRALFRRVQAQ